MDYEDTVWILKTENGIYGVYRTEMAAKAVAYDCQKYHNHIDIIRCFVQ
jgi:hypothetical protein